MKQFTVKELAEVTKCVKNQRPERNHLKVSGLRKHELVNQLSELVGDGSRMQERNTKKKNNPPTLKSAAQRVIMKKTYPKKVLNIAYCNFIWPKKKRLWKKDARVNDTLMIHGIEDYFEPYYVPDKTKDNDFEVFVYDKTHLASNLRKCICLDRVDGVSKAAWEKVSLSSPIVLNPTLLEVNEEGKIVDQMKERLARNMVSEDVEMLMRTQGNRKEADFCQIVRKGLFEADDKPGISAVDRCKQRLKLIEWLSDEVDFGDFPPYGSSIKGLSTTLYEGLRTSNEAKLYLYALVKKGTYSVRAPNTLCSESFFSSMQEMDPWGQGVLTSEGVEKHISDFTTITALKMNDDRSFMMRTKRDTAYPSQPLSSATAGHIQTEPEERLPSCKCRINRFIRCIVPRDHFFDTEQRARNPKKEKPFKFSDINDAGRGDLPIRSQYGYKINETKVFASKRLGINFDE